MTEREPALAEQPLGVRPGDARAEHGLAGHLVERVQLVEPTQIQRDHGVESVRDRGRARRPRWCPRRTGPRRCRARSSTAGPRRSAPRRPGISTASGASCSPVLAPEQVQCRLAARAQQPRAVVDQDRIGSDDRGQRVAVGGASAPTAAAAPRRSQAPAPASPSTPSACSSSDRMPSDSGLAAAGSPQAFHFIGGQCGVRRHALQYYICCQPVTQCRAGHRGPDSRRRGELRYRLRRRAGDARRDRSSCRGQPADRLPPLDRHARDPGRAAHHPCRSASGATCRRGARAGKRWLSGSSQWPTGCAATS